MFGPILLPLHRPCRIDPGKLRGVGGRLMIVTWVAFLVGCKSNALQNTAPTPAPLATAVPAQEIDATVRGFADTFVTRVAEPYTRIATNARTPEERSWALQTRLGQSLAALTDASGPNPSENLLDIVVLVTLQRRSIQEYWIPNLLHDDGQALLAAYKQSETDAWDLAARTFTNQQIIDLKSLIDKWQRENPPSSYTAFIRFTDSIGSSRNRGRNDISASKLLDLLNVDPFKGLDPVTQEAERYRMLSERLVFVGMHLPIILNWQVEAAANLVLQQPDVQRVISTSEQYAKVGDRFNEIVANYPSQYSQATKGAIDQINAAATQQREAIIQQLNSESNQVHDILADARSSITLARDAAGSVNANTAQTIADAEMSCRCIIHQAEIAAIAVIIIGVLWPALVIFAYRFAVDRWLRARTRNSAGI